MYLMLESAGLPVGVVNIDVPTEEHHDLANVLTG
jgi:hypothetical protein